MKKPSAVVLIIVLAIILAFATVACKDSSAQNEQNKASEQNTSVAETDKFYTEGYTKASIPSFEFMYTDLIGSVTSALDVLSASSISSASPCCTMTINGNAFFNGAKYQVAFNLGYDYSNGKDLRWQVDVKDYANSKDNIINIAYFDSENLPTTNMYFAVGDTKFKIPFTKEIVNKDFPLNMNNELSKWFSNVFNSVVRTKVGTTKYEYKLVGGKMNRHYSFEVDILNTLKQLYSLASVFSYDTKNLNYILQSILGISESSVEAGSIPNSTMSFEFFTEGGYQDKAGGGSLKIAHAVLDIEASEIYRDTVFEGKSCQIELDINDMVANKARNTNLPEEVMFADYQEYMDKVFEFQEVITFKDEPNADYDLNLAFLYDAENPQNTDISCTVKNANGDNRFVFDYKNGNLDVTLLGKQLSAQFDLGKATEMITTHFVEYKAPSVIMVIAYFAGAVKVMDYRLSVEFNNNNFKEVSGVDATFMLNVLDECTPEDVNIEELFAENDIDFSEVMQTEFDVKIYLKATI